MALQLLEINSRLIEINKRATRMTYAIRYGQRYYANKDGFEQYIILTQGNLSVMEYADEFERLHYLCELGDTLDFDNFLKGLRPGILKKVEKACNNMYDAFWEAMCVERMLKRSHLVEVVPQEEKSPHKTARVEEPVPTDIQTNLPKLDTEDSISDLEISPIDFVFGNHLCQLGDNPQIIRNSDLMVHVLPVRHINTYFSHQNQLCMKLCQEVIDQPTHRMFVRLIFDPGGHFPNSRSSSFSSGGE